MAEQIELIADLKAQLAAAKAAADGAVASAVFLFGIELATALDAVEAAVDRLEAAAKTAADGALSSEIS